MIETKNVHLEPASRLGSGTFTVKKSQVSVLVGIIIIGAMLINNFVFTKYLGLCIFFGVSQKKGDRHRHGNHLYSSSWFSPPYSAGPCTRIVLNPYNLSFLKIIVFIGTTAIFVQAVDTVLRKINPVYV